jgi:hypothetical protein
MLVVVQHTLTDPPIAFARGERLQRSENAPEGTRALQFLPSADGKLVTCLWESDSVEDVQAYVDETLGEASVNLCYAVEEKASFAEVPEGISTPPVPAVA